MEIRHLNNEPCSESSNCVGCFNDYLLACNPSTRTWTLRLLAKHSSLKVRSAVAANKRTPYRTLLKLAIDSSPEVRLSVAENPSAREDTLDLLIGDHDVDVRYGLAENMYLSMRLLERLQEDDNPFVASRARLSLQKAYSLPERISVSVPEVLTLVENPYLSAEHAKLNVSA
jgi:hypothetical protein